MQPEMLEQKSKEIAANEDANAVVELRTAQALKIDSTEMAEIAADDLGRIKAKVNALDVQRKSMTKPLDEAKSRIMELFRAPIDTLQKAEAAIKGSILDWNRREQERINAERRKHEEEQRKLRAAALETEQLAKAEAAKLIAVGKTAEAELIVEEAAAERSDAEFIAAMTTPITSAPAKLAGTGIRKDWDFEIVNEKKIPREFLMIDEKKIRAFVKAMKNEARIEGVRVFERESVTARARSA